MARLMQILLILFVSLSNAQISFQEEVIMDENLNIGGGEHFVADINGDGLNDIFRSDFEVVVWYENLNGTDFSVPSIISTMEEYCRIYAADLDGDGDNDLITASEDNNTVSWYENTDGQGNFGMRNVIGFNVDGAHYVLAEDIDGDGDLDIVATAHWDNQVLWFENTDGVGTFGPEQIISSSAQWANSVVAVDIDGDGDLDVASSSADDQKIAWYENTNGQGAFGPEQLVFIDIEDKTFVKAGDIDSDGDIDLISDLGNDNEIAWYENTDGLGNFAAPVIISNGDINFVLAKLYDVDNDGDLDVVATQAIANKTVWYENLDGMGNFGSQTIISDETFQPREIYASDMDNDGDLDVVTTTFSYLGLCKNLDGQGNFNRQYLINGSANNPDRIITADFNGDGNQDVLSVSYNKLSWHKNISNSIPYGEEITVDVDQSFFNAIDIGDIDADGDIDIVAFISGFSGFNQDARVVWYENKNGLGDFELPVVVFSYTPDINTPIAIKARDMDGDNRLDIVIATDSSSGDFAVWFKNLDGQGNFGTEESIFSNSNQNIEDLDVFDLDGDSDLDVISSSRLDGKIFWHENIDGNGNFGVERIVDFISPGNSTFSMRNSSGDIDMDGDIDIVAIHQSIDGNFLFWYENLDGLGNFGLRKLIAQDLNNSIAELILTDVDSDADLDIIYAHWVNDQLAWIQNLDGLGNFGLRQVLTQEHRSPSGIAASDLNNDGNIDIIASFVNDHRISYFTNLGLLNNSLYGAVRLDVDINGCDTEDIYMSSVLMIANDGTNDIATFTSENGFYQFFLDPGTYVTEVSPSGIPNYYDPSPTNQTTNFPTVGDIDEANFCLTPIGTQDDLNVVIYPLSDARPGFSATYEIVFRNVGTTLKSGSTMLSYDSTKMNLSSTSEPISSQTGNSVSFDYMNLLPSEFRAIVVEFDILPPPATQINDILLFEAIVQPTSGDITPLDNQFELEQIVVDSFDPNDITVLEGDEIFLNQADDYLHYLIRFQNTGTASAINVRVTNELDPNLDWSTMQLEMISHPNRVEITNGNLVEFIFNNINLPDSNSNEPASHGYIQYKIKPISSVGLGDSMSNNANIFFDFNPPILTNTVTTTIVEATNPIAGQASDIVVCGNSQTSVFDLTSTEPEILNGQNPTEHIISYHESQMDANNGTNPIINSVNYVNTSNPQTIYARLERISDGAFDTSSFDLEVSLNPSIVPISQYILPDVNNDGIEIFDLTTKITEILNGQSNVEVTFYETQSNANSGINPIAVPESYTNVNNPQTIYVRLENDITSCFAVTSFEIFADPNLGLMVYNYPSILIYPNPVVSQLNIVSDVNVIALILRDQLGQVILNVENYDGIHEVGMEQLSTGVYFLYLKDEQQNSTIIKVIKN